MPRFTYPLRRLSTLSGQASDSRQYIRIHAWGAAGGTAETYPQDTGGGGGYGQWQGYCQKGTLVYVFVGEGGIGGATSGGIRSGGWPNGGDSLDTGGSGGGMSAVCFENALVLDNLLMGAGAGGGGTFRSNGEGKAGAGGGTDGQDAPSSPSGSGHGGTQTGGGTGGPGVDGSLLQGGDQNTAGGGGGGGGYYGGEGGVSAVGEGGGGGGSAFVKTSLLPGGWGYVSSFLETGNGYIPPQTENLLYPGSNVGYAVETAGANGNPGAVVIENLVTGEVTTFLANGGTAQEFRI